jgi:hypothetical protein
MKLMAHMLALGQTCKHVCEVSLALFFFTCQWLKRADPDHVESSLWTWIPQHCFMEINRTFGSMAQLVILVTFVGSYAALLHRFCMVNHYCQT